MTQVFFPTLKLTLTQTMIDQLVQTPLRDLQAEAFRIRKETFGDELTFSVPGVIAYHSDEVLSPKNRFAAISVTGKQCALQCGHCRGKLLESMIPAETPDILLQVTQRLRSEGAHGVLISGGADEHGEVPLEEIYPGHRKDQTDSPRIQDDLSIRASFGKKQLWG